VDQLPPAVMVWPDPKPQPEDPKVVEARAKVKGLERQYEANIIEEAHAKIEQMKRDGVTLRTGPPSDAPVPFLDLKADKNSKLPRLSVLSDFPQQYQRPARTVAAIVAKFGLNPDEYYVEVQAHEGDGLLHFQLWHQSALKQRDDSNLLGDPSGKCRTVLYDPHYDWVTKIYGWK
jgi:hypothetical protein